MNSFAIGLHCQVTQASDLLGTNWQIIATIPLHPQRFQSANLPCLFRQVFSPPPELRRPNYAAGPAFPHKPQFKNPTSPPLSLISRSDTPTLYYRFDVTPQNQRSALPASDEQMSYTKVLNQRPNKPIAQQPINTDENRMNPWSMSFFRGIIAIALISLLYQTSVVAQTETTQPKSDSEASEAPASKTTTSISERRNLAIENAFENLRHRKFGVRQAATQHLANAGLSALPKLETRALTGDVDFQNNCICIISAIGQQMRGLDQATAALERLSQTPNFDSAGKASEELSRLKKYQTVRAIRVLREEGVRVSQSGSNGQVTYVSNLTQDGQCEHLKHFSYLASVTLQGAEITDASIEPLSKIPKLTQLSLTTTNISPEGMTRLKRCGNLHSLSLMGTYSAAHIRALTQVDQLSIVRLYTRIGDEELIAAAKLEVSELAFTTFKSTEKTAEIMRTVKASRLQFSLSGIKDDDLKWISGNKTPTLRININSSTELTDEGMRFLENADITSLSMNNTGITAKAMRHLGTLTNLETLMITNDPIDDESLKHLSNLQKLRTLRLQGTEVTGDGMAKLKEKLKNLRFISPAAAPNKLGK